MFDHFSTVWMKWLMAIKLSCNIFSYITLSKIIPQIAQMYSTQSIQHPELICFFSDEHNGLLTNEYNMKKLCSHKSKRFTHGVLLFSV